ncbi:hypothetical protein ES689_09130 [Frigoribacterium sp. ACAM 257]|uniref:hypothetical protein n=1 Tax=Frigoribacterium sp. ACAM 257 TaxID=2508998 RepID=UPI0011B9DF11|nr:hypothetical protein [Frigoribacterium sp. ACAM 257]TWX38762.1 hypothetical protein ES689_09130 [Frigoribacterium sp. ACAM 257]
MSSDATAHDDTAGHDDTTGMTADEKRHDQLTRAPKSDETDAAPRITAEDRSHGVTRIDVADTAKVRPGGGEAHTRD